MQNKRRQSESKAKESRHCEERSDEAIQRKKQTNNEK
jgi:hypothetical protein